MLILFHLESLHYNTNSRNQISPLGCRRSKPIDFSLIFLTLILSLTSPEGLVRSSKFISCPMLFLHLPWFPYFQISNTVNGQCPAKNWIFPVKFVVAGHNVRSFFLIHVSFISCLLVSYFSKVSFMPLLSPWQQWLIMIRIVYHRLFGEW